MLFRSRGLLVQQRTQTINALRGHPAEFGLVVQLGIHNVERLEEAFVAREEHFPAPAPPAIRLLIERIGDLNVEIDEMDREIRRIVRDDECRQDAGQGLPGSCLPNRFVVRPADGRLDESAGFQPGGLAAPAESGRITPPGPARGPLHGRSLPREPDGNTTTDPAR